MCPSVKLLNACRVSLAALLLLVSALALPSQSSMADSGETTNALPLSKEPVHVTSDSLTADGNKNFVTFIGSVVAKQADMVIYADQLMVYYASESKSMDRAEADGNVRVLRGEQVATADHAVYESRTETIFLSGNPKVRQGESFLVGAEITIYLRERRSVVHAADGGRVNAVFSPEDAPK